MAEKIKLQRAVWVEVRWDDAANNLMLVLEKTDRNEWECYDPKIKEIHMVETSQIVKVHGRLKVPQIKFLTKK